MARPKPGRAIILSILFSIFCIGVYDVLKNYEDNHCEMTYMFENPEYIKIELSQNISRAYHNYNLYLYGEGHYARDVVASNFRMNGIPVLFIPGNAGSFRQVRSLGSVALRMAEKLNSRFHFNFFSLDLNEELSGLHGPFLFSHTEFAYECIQHILKLYDHLKTNKPQTVLLVGHSMGGLIARALFTLPGFDHNLVKVIITQATPHQMPVVALDSFISDFYDKVNSYWTNSSSGSKLEDVVVVSSGGGFRDLLVRNGLTSLKKIVNSKRHISTSTMSIPKAWVSTDHLCHVWCKQVVLATIRALFDCVNTQTKQISFNSLRCLEAFHHHFVKNSGSYFYKPIPKKQPTIGLDENLALTISKEKYFNYQEKQVVKGFNVVIEINKDKVSSRFAFVAVTNMKQVPWIGGCSLQTKSSECKEMTVFDSDVFLVPPLKSNLKVIHLDGVKLSQFPHLVMQVPQSKIPVMMVADAYEVAKRHLVYEVPHFTKFLWNFLTSFSSSEVIIETTKTTDVFYNVTLKNFEIPLQAYAVEITCETCDATREDVDAMAVVKLHVPWNHEDVYTTLRRGDSGRMSLKLQSGRPVDSNASVEMHFFFVPSCSYKITMQLSLSEVFGQIFRFYGSCILTFLVIQLLMTLSWQMSCLAADGVVPSFSEAHARWAQPYRVVPVASGIRYIISQFEGSDIIRFLGLPQDNTQIFKDNDTFHSMLPLFLYAFAYANVAILSPLAQGFISLVSKFTTLLFRKVFSNSSSLINLLTAGQYIILIIGAFAAHWFCGTIGLILALGVHFCKLLICYEEARMKGPEVGTKQWNKVHIGFTIFLLILASVHLNMVSFVVWLKGFSQSLFLVNDPSRSIGTIACISSLSIIYSSYKMERSMKAKMMKVLSYVSPIFMVLYAMVSVYRVSYFISAILMTLAITSDISRQEEADDRKETGNIEEKDDKKETDDRGEKDDEKETPDEKKDK